MARKRTKELSLTLNDEALQLHKATLEAHTLALRTHINVLKAHTSSINNLVAVLSIPRHTILARLCQIWQKDPKKVKETDQITKYVQGGPAAMSAFADVLNNSPEFKSDGLDLQSNDTGFVTTVGQLIDVIAHWYSAHK